jgi:hypothetical protein
MAPQDGVRRGPSAGAVVTVHPDLLLGSDQTTAGKHGWLE